jgi:hypothetical protein
MANRIAQVILHLPSKYEALMSIPNIEEKENDSM